MERPIVKGCCCGSSSIRKGVNVTPDPSTWQSLGDFCQDVAQCLSSNGPNGKRLIVHFFLPGTQIRIDIGNVKAAGVLCVLGISFGIGTYVLYKIYDRFIRPKVRRKDSVETDEDEEEEEEDVYCETNPDEVNMGNQQSSQADIPVYYKKGYGVSLHKWNSEEPVCLRNRRSPGHQLAITEQVLRENLCNKNGLAGRDHIDGRDHVDGFSEHNSQEVVEILKGNLGKGHRPPSLKELRIDVDENGLEENGNGGELKLSSSLVGNFSPTSLCEKNIEFILKSDSDIDIDGGQGADVSKELVNNNSKNGSPKNKNKANCGKLDQLKIDNKYNASSVLLTPPSEDELSSSQHNYSCSAPHSTKSDVSEIRSEVAEPHYEPPGTDDEREMLSPLPFDRSPHASPERQFKNKLALKLNQISSRGFVPILNSNASSSSSTPDSYRSHKRSNSTGGERERENSISGVSSPELEMLPSETSETAVVAEKTFNNIEDEIHSVEYEFEDISKQISDLTKRYSDSHTHVPGAHIFEDIFQRYPSIRVRQQEKGVQYMPSLSDYDSSQRLSTSEDKTDSASGQASDVFDSEGKSMSETEDKNTSETESADLSWDMEHVLDMVYSEVSESGSHSNPAVGDRLKVIPEQCEMSSSGGSLKLLEDSSFNSAVDMEGSIYEEDYFLQLGSGTAASPQSEERPEPESDQQESPTLKYSVCNIGARQNLAEYADTEWKGTTERAETIRKAYREIPKHCQCHHLRKIRGDNYCGIRGVVFQTLVNGLPPRHVWSSRDTALNRLVAAYHSPTSGIEHWTFAGRIPHTPDNKLDVMTRCIKSLYAKFEELEQHSLYSEREQILEHHLNSDPDSDLDLMEGVKLLMLLSAINLWDDMQQGVDVPVFSWLLFARDTSEDLESFVKNHLNPVGCSGGLEQVEMFLLGYSLGVRIQVFRLQQFGQEDFISNYPDDCGLDCQTVSLIAEDDRHYNVPVL